MTDPIDHLLVVALEALRIAGRPLDHLELNEEVHREHFDLDFQRRHFLRLKTRFATNLEELPDVRIQWIGDDEPMDGAMAVSDVGARSAKPRSTARTVKVSSMAPPHASAAPCGGGS